MAGSPEMFSTVRQLVERLKEMKPTGSMSAKVIPVRKHSRGGHETRAGATDQPAERRHDARHRNSETLIETVLWVKAGSLCWTQRTCSWVGRQRLGLKAGSLWSAGMCGLRSAPPVLKSRSAFSVLMTWGAAWAIWPMRTRDRTRCTSGAAGDERNVSGRSRTTAAAGFPPG